MKLFTFKSGSTQMLAFSYVSLFNRGVVWYQFGHENTFISNHWFSDGTVRNATVKEL